jgi:hypothetical protein
MISTCETEVEVLDFLMGYDYESYLRKRPIFFDFSLVYLHANISKATAYERIHHLHKFNEHARRVECAAPVSRVISSIINHITSLGTSIFEERI